MFIFTKKVVHLVGFILDMGKSQYPHLYPNTSLETFLVLVYFCKYVLPNSDIIFWENYWYCLKQAERNTK